ncbi:alkaline phosphatase family protein [Helicobacter sp. MIT 05-5293]|uniref:LTA synthase family protein n=1 Tax=Helicobacter sp. MIT 05-5293 TaxID=1548149 RepID=UPI000AA59158|nr:alkaline phosphatase family protein [Helicobacter sp. MIT 05-5293]
MRFVQLIIRASILMLFLIFICFLSRLILVLEYLPQNLWSEYGEDFKAMWLMGFRLDMRAIGIAMLGYIILNYIMLLFDRIYSLNANHQRTLLRFSSSFLSFFTHFYAFLLGFIFVVFAFISFYYYQTYGGKIDVFIFELKDDNTWTILEIIWRDYPLITGILISLIAGLITLWLHHTFSKIPQCSHQPFCIFKQNIIGTILNLGFIIMLVIASRGSLGTFPIKENNYHISSHAIFNDLAANPIMAFDWALKNYRADMRFYPVAKNQEQKFQEELFPIYHQTPTNTFAAENPPHIIVNLMESFGSNLLAYDNPQDFDLLGDLREHLQNDFMFYRFLSAANWTAPSFVALFFESPFDKIAQGHAKTIKLALNPFEIYANAGYETIFITSGHGSWKSLGEYIKTQGGGGTQVFDTLSLLKAYPEAKYDENGYGVADEYAYRLAFDILSRAQKPTFIAILTTSNHPPYLLPRNYTPIPLTIPQDIINKTQDSEEKTLLAIQLYQYANDAFGKFMNNIKNSSLKEKTIVAASGDHHVRNLTIDPSLDKALGYAVPLYLYVPKPYQDNTLYDPLRFGSHKDIFPTLYELSLSRTNYMSIGGRNILARIQDSRYDFGYNALVWIDKQGIYPVNSTKGYAYSPSQKMIPLVSSEESFELDSFKKNFATKYHELLVYEINKRIMGVKTEE